MKQSPSAKLPGVEGPEPSLSQLNQATLVRIAMAFVLTFLMASTAPSGLVLPFFNSMLFFWSVGSAVVAVAFGERLFAPSLTHWDEAAACGLGTVISGWCIDPLVVQRALEAARLGG